MSEKKSQAIRAVDLFCGVGGMTHGLQAAGINVVRGYDNDPKCRFPYEENNNSIFEESDVYELDPGSIVEQLDGAELTLMAGCAPCQPFSTYSQSSRKVRPNEDWMLVERFAEIAAEVGPDFVVMENVPRLLEHPVLGEFESILDGYEVSKKVIDVSTLGIPQTRRRLIVVASRLGSVDLDFGWARGGHETVRQAISGLPPLKAGERDSADVLHASSRLSPKNLERIQESVQGGTWRDWPEHLLADCHKKRSGASYPSVYGRMVWDLPSPTITTQCFGYGNGRFGHPDQDRAISLREAAILQSFPADYKFVGNGGRVSFSQVGRWIGNAVPVRLAQLVGIALLRHIENDLTL